MTIHRSSLGTDDQLAIKEVILRDLTDHFEVLYVGVDSLQQVL